MHRGKQWCTHCEWHCVCLSLTELKREVATSAREIATSAREIAALLGARAREPGRAGSGVADVPGEVAHDEPLVLS